MTEALAHVDTAEAQFATVASDEEYESKQRDLQRIRDDIADFEVQLLRLQEEKTAAAAALSACASKIEQEIRRLDVRHVELSAGVEEAALALYCHTRGRRDIRIAAVKRGGCHTQSPSPPVPPDAERDPPHNDGAHIHKLRVHNHLG